MLTSEVFTNSVIHSDSRHGGSVMVALAACWTLIHVDVVDAGGESFPHLRGDALSEGGRGLLLVDLLADRWDAYEDDAGRTVWFEVKCDGGGIGSGVGEETSERRIRRQLRITRWAAI